jgi:hypothetical protein
MPWAPRWNHGSTARPFPYYTLIKLNWSLQRDPSFRTSTLVLLFGLRARDELKRALSVGYVSGLQSNMYNSVQKIENVHNTL